MRKFLLIIISVILMTTGAAANPVKLNAAYANSPELQRFNRMSSGRLLDKADEFIWKRQMPDSALMALAVLTNRYAPSMTKEEKKVIITGFNRIWYVYFFSYNDFAAGKEALCRALEISDECGVPKGELYLNLGAMYQRMGELGNDRMLFQESVKNMKLAFSELDPKEDERFIDMLLGNLSIVCNAFGDMGEMSDVVAKVRDRCKKDKAFGNRWIVRYNLLLYDGYVKMQEGRYQDALDIFERQKRLLLNIEGSIRRHLLTDILIAKNLMSLHQYGNAGVILQKCMATAQEYGVGDARLEILALLEQNNRQLGDTARALDYRARYLEAKDSLLNYRQIESVKEMGIYSQRRALEQEISDMKQHDLEQKWIIMLSAVILVMSGVVIAVTVIKNRRLNASNQALYEKVQESLRSDRQLGESIADTNAESHVRQDVEEEDMEKYRNSQLDEEVKDGIKRKILAVVQDSKSIYDPEFSLRQLSDMTEVNEKYVSQVINDVFGCNFKTFINDYRVKHACSLIDVAGTKLNFTVESLANDVGFRSRSTFITAFKKFTGMTPSQYIKIAVSRNRT